MSLLRRYRDPLVVLVLVLVSFAFYWSNSKAVRDHNAFDRVVVWLSSPIQWLVVTTVQGVSDTWNSYVALVGVQEENAVLREQVDNLRAEVAAREEEKLENQRLRLLLDLRDRSGDVKPITARVIGTSPTPLFRSVRINRGTEDGVHLGAAVVHHDGIVGRVGAVTSHWSDVMLIVDANNSTDVMVQRTRARARIRGLGGDQELAVRIEYLARTEDVTPGDILITSGAGSVFPKGLRVGEVVSVEQRAFGLYQNALMEPSVDFRRLEEVMVIPRGWPASTNYEDDLGPAPEPDTVSNAPEAVDPTPSVPPPTAPEGRMVEGTAGGPQSG